MFYVVFLLLTTSNVHTTFAATMDETALLMDDLFRNYSKDLRPVEDQNNVLNVSVDFSLISINNFDEVAGVISVVALLYISWRDESLVWNTSHYGNVSFLTFSQRKVWLPKLFLTNPAESFKPISNKHFVVTVQSDGSVVWVPGDILTATCTPDVSKFPFDKQTCDIGLNPWGYSTSQISISTPSSTVSLVYYSKNSEWIIVNSSAAVMPPANAATFSFTIERRPLSFLVAVVMPIIMLAFVNPLCFILPFDSGERASYSITVLLAFSVYMTVVSDRMPASSDPMSGLSFYLLGMIALSVLIVTINIFQMRIYGKNDKIEPVPAWVNTFAMKFRVLCRQRKVEAKEAQIKDNRKDDAVTKTTERLTSVRLDSISENESKFDAKHQSDEPERVQYMDGSVSSAQDLEASVSWKTVGKTLDKIYFGICCLITVLSSAIYFLVSTS